MIDMASQRPNTSPRAFAQNTNLRHMRMHIQVLGSQDHVASHA